MWIVHIQNLKISVGPNNLIRRPNIFFRRTNNTFITPGFNFLSAQIILPHLWISNILKFYFLNWFEGRLTRGSMNKEDFLINSWYMRVGLYSSVLTSGNISWTAYHRYLNPIISRIGGIWIFSCMYCLCSNLRKLTANQRVNIIFNLKVVNLSFNKYFDLYIIGYGIQ